MDVTLVVELDDSTYEELLTAANEFGVPVSEYATKIVKDYLEVDDA
jgi:hypothetical protein